MANLTDNLQLIKPLATEQYNIEVFNTNAGLIEGARGTNNSASNVPNKSKTVDGTGSGLDADLVKGKNGFYYDFAWYDNVAYSLNAIRSYNGILYKSLFDNNLGNNPASSEKWSMLTLGASPGVTVRAVDVVYDDTATMLFASNLQAALEATVAKINAVTQLVNTLVAQIGPGGGVIIQGTAPVNTKCLWIDTAENSVAKYYNSLTATWDYVGSVYS